MTCERSLRRRHADRARLSVLAVRAAVEELDAGEPTVRVHRVGRDPEGFRVGVVPEERRHCRRLFALE